MGQPTFGRPFIPTHPEIFNERVSLIISVFSLMIVVLVGIVSSQLLSGFAQNPAISLGIAGLCWVFLVVRRWVRLRALQGIESQRVAFSLRESASVRNREVPSQSGVSFPCLTIVFVPHGLTIWMYTLAFSLFAILLFLFPFITVITLNNIFLFLILLLCIIGFLLLFLFRSILFVLKEKIMIEVTEDGFQMRKGGTHLIQKQISWNEAQFFACYTLPNLFPGQKTCYYELSSSTEVVTWISLSRFPSLFSMWKPQLPFEEYQEQMQTLCDFVTLKTGLRLQSLSGSETEHH